MSASSGAAKQGIVRSGGKMVCPGCGKEEDVLVGFIVLQRNPEYERDLNPVYKHQRARGGCGHTFSPGDPWIIEEYLAGNLIPKSLLVAAQKTIEALEAALAGTTDNSHDDERRPVGA
jgi:hypothetical protein